MQAQCAAQRSQGGGDCRWAATLRLAVGIFIMHSAVVSLSMWPVCVPYPPPPTHTHTSTPLHTPSHCSVRVGHAAPGQPGSSERLSVALCAVRSVCCNTPLIKD